MKKNIAIAALAIALAASWYSTHSTKWECQTLMGGTWDVAVATYGSKAATLDAFNSCQAAGYSTKYFGY